MGQTFVGRKNTITIQKAFFRNRAVTRSLFFRAPKMVLYKVTEFSKGPQAGDYKVKWWFCVRPYNHPL